MLLIPEWILNQKLTFNTKLPEKYMYMVTSCILMTSQCFLPFSIGCQQWKLRPRNNKTVNIWLSDMRSNLNIFEVFICVITLGPIIKPAKYYKDWHLHNQFGTKNLSILDPFLNQKSFLHYLPFWQILLNKSACRVKYYDDWHLHIKPICT